MTAEKKDINILVIGDIIQDRYAYVTTERISAEAPIPVWDELRSETRPGGAANVAMNLKSMFGFSGNVHLAGIVDSEYKRFLAVKGLNVDLCVSGEVFSDTPISSIIKQRFVKHDTLEYIARFDNARTLTGRHVASYFARTIQQDFKDDFFDAVIVSDYNAGAISDEVARFLCKKQNRSPLFVDSKREDLSVFDKSFFLKVNEQEYSAQVSSKLYDFFGLFFENVIVTLGANGCELHRSNMYQETDFPRSYCRTDKEHFRAEKTRAVDVTGCGDTFVAAVVYYMAAVKDDLRHALMFANKCAAIVVQRFGTSVVSWQDIDVLLNQ